MQILLFALLSSAQSEALPRCEGLMFSVAPALARTIEQVCVRPHPDGPRGDLLFRHRSGRQDGPLVTRYARLSACPAMRAKLSALEQLPMPTPDVPGFGRSFDAFVLDGASYVLESGGLYPEGPAALRLHTNVNTPLARWMEATLRTLRPCLRDRPSG